MGAARYEGAFSLTESSGPAYERRGAVAKRAGARLPGHTPNNLYETRDGEHIHIAAANQSLFRRLAVLMERSDLLDDPRFSTPVARTENEDALDDIIGAWVCGQDIAEVERKNGRASCRERVCKYG